MCFCDSSIRTESHSINPVLIQQLGIAIITSQPLNHTSLLASGVTDEHVSLLEYILKLNWASWLLKTPLLWSLKACMVVLFLRLTNNLPWMRKATVAAGAFIVVTFFRGGGDGVADVRPREE